MEKMVIFPQSRGNFKKIIKKIFIFLEDEKMARVQTSVMIDEDKRALAKQRGIKLQDILDEALDTVLQLNVPGKAQLENDKEEILKEIELIDQQKEEYLKKYDEKKAHLNLRMGLIDKALEHKADEMVNMEQQNQYNEFVNHAIEHGAIDDIIQDIQAHAHKYNLDLIQLVDDIQKEAFNM